MNKKAVLVTSRNHAAIVLGSIKELEEKIQKYKDIMKLLQITFDGKYFIWSNKTLPFNEEEITFRFELKIGHNLKYYDMLYLGIQPFMLQRCTTLRDNTYMFSMLNQWIRRYGHLRCNDYTGKFGTPRRSYINSKKDLDLDFIRQIAPIIPHMQAFCEPRRSIMVYIALAGQWKQKYVYLWNFEHETLL